MTDMKYNSTAQTAPDGGSMAFQCDANGNLKTVSASSGSTADQVQGNVAAAGTDAGNPVKIGGLYSSSLPTLTNGKRGDWQLSAKGAGLVTLFTAAGVEVPFPAALAANGGLKRQPKGWRMRPCAIEVHAWPGGTVGADLKPFTIDLRAKSVSGAWKITTGANVICTAFGDFT